MKKFLLMLACAALTLSTVACGGSEKSSDSGDGAQENGKDSSATEMTVETELGSNVYEITFACPAGGVVINDVPEIPEDGEEITPEEQELIDLYASVEPLYVDPPMLVCDDYVMAWGCDWYNYPYDATDMDDYFAKLEENGVKKIELTEINGQKAIIQDYDSMYIVRIATDDPVMYAEFDFTPNDPEALAEADGNMSGSPYIEIAREFIKSDILKTAYESIQIKQK